MVLAFQFLVLFCGLATLSVFLAKFHKMEFVAVYELIGGVLKFSWSQVCSMLSNQDLPARLDVIYRDAVTQ